MKSDYDFACDFTQLHVSTLHSSFFAHFSDGKLFKKSGQLTKLNIVTWR